MGLLLVYGLNNWLPTIMREAGYDLGDALAFLLVLNVGAIVGLLIAGRWPTGSVRGRPASPGSPAPPSSWRCCRSSCPIAGIYVMVFLTGCLVFSAQVLVYAFVSANHPPQVRPPRWAGRPARAGSARSSDR